MLAANVPSPAARRGSLPTLPRRVESVGLADWVSFGRLVRRIGACEEDRGLGGCRGGFGGIDSTLLGRVAGEERTRGEGLFEEWRVARLMPAANGPSPVARLGSLPTLPRRVEAVGVVRWKGLRNLRWGLKAGGLALRV